MFYKIKNFFETTVNLQIIKLLSALMVMFVVFFSNIHQINSLSIQNNKTRIISNENKKKETQKEYILSQNRAILVQDIDKKLASKEIQNTVIGENIKLSELENILKNQQPTPTKNTSTLIVAR